MIYKILSGAPYWVWPLLAALVFAGVKALKRRNAPSFLIYLQPALGFLTISAISRLPSAPYIWAIFIAFYAIGVWFGHRYQRSILLEKTGRRITLRGEPTTLFLMMALFWMNFATGMIKSISPTLYASPTFHALFAIITSFAAGIFLGRALWVILAPNEETSPA